MNRPLVTLFLLVFYISVHSQQERLPADLRQHNLTTFNASLLNPAFSVDRNNPQSIALWSRWQWQNIDANPTTLFLNYTRPFNERSAAGIGFFQHNTGIFFQTGAVLNYAYSFTIGATVKLHVGANLLGYEQKLADDRFLIDANPLLPSTDETNSFILQMAPGINLEIQRFSLSLTSDNLLDYNVTAKEGNTATSEKIFMSQLSYDFPVGLGSVSNSFIRPSVYMKTVPDQSNQFGLNALLHTNRYYGQVGYNNLYGYALGGGYTFFDRVTVGALWEFGTDASLQKDASFEIAASYFLGTPNERHTIVGYERDNLNPLEEIEGKQDEAVAEDKAIAEAIAANEQVEKEKKEAERQVKKDAKQQRKLEKTEQDSLTKVQKQAELAALKEQEQRKKKAFKTAERKKTEIEEQQRRLRKETIEIANKNEAEAKQQQKELNTQGAENAKMTEAINIADQADLLKAEHQRKLDSVEKIKADVLVANKKANQVQLDTQKSPVRPMPGERYEEVQMENGLLPGFYLIANVFSTTKYYNQFMTDLKTRGIQPKSFKMAETGYYYVFLKRYSSIKAARAGRDSNFEGQYAGATWIFRVLNE